LLKGIDPLLTPDLLKILAQMGHDDALVVADCNFTAERLAAGKPVIRLPGVGLVRAIQAITSLLPLAQDVNSPVSYMQVGGTQAPYRSAVQREVADVVEPLLKQGQSLEGVERFAFYDRAAQAFAIVLTAEAQPWANVILRKGVIGESLRP
jgi:L-fucose mutarotase